MRNTYCATPSNMGIGINLMGDMDKNHMHDAILESLGTVGVKFESNDALEILAGHGVKVCKDSKVARFPGYIVEDAIAAAPGHFYLYGKSPEYDRLLGDGRVNWIPFGCGIKTKDLETGEIRNTTKQDIADNARITEALPEYDVCMQTVVAQDVPSHVEELHSFTAHAYNTNKNVTVGPMGKRSAETLVKIAAT